MQRNTSLPAALTLLAVLLLAMGAWRPSLAAAERPFKLKGTVQIQGNPNAPGGAPLVNASGTATHLGRFTGGGHVQFTEVPGQLTSQGEFVLRAANGDLLFAEFAAVGTSPTAVRSGPWVFTGGTGRFEDAEGEAIVRARNLGGGLVEFTVEGTIDY